MNMKIKLNYKTDTPTKNNRIYKKGVLESALTKAIEKGLPIIKGFSNPPNIENILGKITGFSNNDYIILETEIHDKQIIDMIKNESLIVTTCGLGHIKPNNKIYEVTDIQLKSINLIPNTQEDEDGLIR